jgi:tRNA A-37 threonylcarbamoyl transferase component Bud32
MMALAPCTYGEVDLLPLALGQPGSDDLHAHVLDCPSCQQRLVQLRSESSTLRRALLQSTIREGSTGTSTPEDRVPGTIGKYFVVGKLGQGAQATAYRALHPQLDKELVIKYGRQTVGPEAEERNLLVREGRLLAGLDHPNIARIYDLDFHNGHPFLVLEYLRGVNLEQFVKRRKPRPRAAAALLAPLARALGAAHRRGIVHQDVKPGNLLIDEDGKPHVLDFGLARLHDAWSAGTEEPDGGTIAYMAPEQARGESGKVSAASDIFALGGVLYFLLTGNPPFVAADWREARQRAGRCEFNRAALRGHGIPRRLAAICLRAMAAEPAERYASAEDLAADLESSLRRPRRLFTLAAALIILAACLCLWHLWPASFGPIIAPSPPPLEQPLVTMIQHSAKGKPGVLKTPDELARHMPLRPGDTLELSCDVPRGYASALFLLDASGGVRELEPLHIGKAGALDRIRFPTQGVWQVERPAGTVVFLMCANRQSKPGLEGMRRLIQDIGGQKWRLPLPEVDVLYLVSRERVAMFVDEVPRGVIDNQLSRLRDDLERLQVQASAHFDHVWGVALPVR